MQWPKRNRPVHTLDGHRIVIETFAIYRWSSIDTIRFQSRRDEMEEFRSGEARYHRQMESRKSLSPAREYRYRQ